MPSAQRAPTPRPRASSSSSRADHALRTSVGPAFAQDRRPPRAAWRRLTRAMTLVKRLSLTTVVYSSGPVTPWMWNVPLPRPSQNPRSTHIRAVSTRMSMPSRIMKSSSPVALTYFAQGVGDVGVDVVLRGAGGVVGRGLLAVDRAPREERARLRQLARATAGRVEHAGSGTAARSRAIRRRGVGEERQDVDLGVPEVVALVAGAGDALGRDAGLLGAGAGLRELEQVPADRLLDRRGGRRPRRRSGPEVGRASAAARRTARRRPRRAPGRGCGGSGRRARATGTPREVW